jgi:hypothetical protein
VALGAVLPWQGEAGRRRKAGSGGAPPASVQKEEEEAQWAKRLNMPEGLLGRLG